MTEVTATNIKKHISGDQVKVTATLANIQNGFTFTVPHLSNIEDVQLTPTTGAVLGCTTSGNVITFADGATLAAGIAVYGR